MFSAACRLRMDPFFRRLICLLILSESHGREQKNTSSGGLLRLRRFHSLCHSTSPPRRAGLFSAYRHTRRHDHGCGSRPRLIGFRLSPRPSGVHSLPRPPPRSHCSRLPGCFRDGSYSSPSLVYAGMILPSRGSCQEAKLYFDCFSGRHCNRVFPAVRTLPAV